MIVTLLNRENIHSITLPEKVRGQYWIDEFFDNKKKKVMGIEGINGEWILKSNKEVKLIGGNDKPVRNTVLEPLSIYPIKKEDSENTSYIFTEPSTYDRQKFTKFLVGKDVDISIGRSSQNDIVLNNKFVSSEHAVLSVHHGEWTVTDKGSTNGTFVNGRRVEREHTALHIGDVIYIMGFKLIIGSQFISFNNPDGTVSQQMLKPFVSQKVELIDEEEEFEAPEVDYFYRSPRFKRDVERKQFKVDSPPPDAIGEEMPLMLVLGPSMTMGMASMATAIFAVNRAMEYGDFTRAIPSVVMSISMLLGTILWPILTKKFDRKRRRKKEKVRQEKYKQYLNKIAVLFNEEIEKQEEILRENHPPVTELIHRIENVDRNLWERGFGQNDFLKLRIGLGQGLLNADINYSEKKFSIDDDNLQEELYTLCESPKILNDIPITLSLFENHISGVIGDRKQTLSFAKGLIFQLATLYSYDEVKMIFIYDEEEEEDFGFTKWLPHVWSNDNKFRFIATNQNEMKEVSAYIENEIETRIATNESKMEDITPYYIVFAMSKKLANRAEMLKQVYAKKENLHISVLTFYDEIKNLPKECTMVVELDDNQTGKLFDKSDITGETTSFKPDLELGADATDLSVKLANIPLDAAENSFNLPKTVTFLEMFGVGKVEHLNALTRWKDNDPTKSLEAPVGVDTLGDLFKLDLHEKFHGPHGLVAGMTGSGKSEFIIAYILSLAVNYHPDEVAFILIDYKGGGMAKSFENLPHTAGIITNLDGAAIKRSLVSIESELKRRQAIFAEASKKVGESNIDIYKYQKLYREKIVVEPLQHLFIISDEFAELKTQQPEFMTQLVSAARIGRSLGIHLILATQKPSGVVDDQIWSNSKFRVSLKVQEKADSMDMLKRPDAAELTDTGRFYLQVGYNELFEMGQSAWAGAPYYPSDKVVVEKDDSVVVIDRNGRSLKQAKVDKRKFFTNPKKQLDVITDYLNNIAAEEQIQVRPLWLEPIPAMILLERVKEKYKITRDASFDLNPVIGEYDDPARQRQGVLRLPLSEEGNTIVYGSAGSGKTTFLNTMVYSLMQDHTPEEVNIYLLDFASETLRAFAKAPHVGDVILSYDSEKVSNLFKMLQKEVEFRKKRFADYGGDLTSYVRATGEKIPSIVVAINNFAAFTETYEEKEEAVSYLSREGKKYGIYFVLTALGTNAVRFRLMQNFKQLLVLQVNDEADYSAILGKTNGLFPSKHKGRGLVKKEEIYEFQIAHITEKPVPFQFIQSESIKLQEEWKGTSAKKIPILPEQVDREFLSEYVEPNQGLTVPIGVEKHSLKVHSYPFDKNYIQMILSAENDHQRFAQDLATFIADHYDDDVTVIDGVGSFTNRETRATYYATTTEFEQAVTAMFDLVVYRNNTYKDALEHGVEPEEFEHKVIIINSIVALKNALSNEGAEKLGLILEKGEAKYNITFILSEQSKNLSSITFDKWYKRHINPGDGIWVGSGISEQYHLKPTKLTAEMRDDIPSAFGFSLIKGKGVMVKLLNSEKENGDE
ncbi:type VII secretion protein EssC [Oceanobacillus sp. Castelsardo]|uniref:type VII secretion protein EssC n=1 Tax=Oceanobacillus sp. Castelsardo TaxID=1851204 RepID=UPI000838BF72|nr:type VII secretion protein EssC [Oceanobacillus sp. Castelsardo]